MNEKRKIVIIGLDGVPYRLIKEMSFINIMENTKRLIENGIFRKMESSIPEVSSVAWSSIITGVNPGFHGIFGFMDFSHETYRLSFLNFNDLKVTPFWKRWEDRIRSIVINVPFTFPAHSLNGVLISGFVALDVTRATYPKSLVSYLKEIDYRIDVDSEKVYKSIELFLKDLDKTLDSRKIVYRHLWEEKWNLFVLVFTGTDRLLHFLWDAYEDKSHKYHSYLLDYFYRIDKIIGEIAERLKENDVLILLSDHGFEALEKDVNVNFLLKKKGLLKLSHNSPGRWRDIDYNTKAFALDPARIYINTETRYSRGSVKVQDKDSLLEEIEAIFNSLKINGRKVIRRICRKEEIFEGPFLNKAPDLILLPNNGFNLRANLEAKELYEKGIFTGKHTQEDAFILVNDKSYKDIIPDNPSVCDVVGILGRMMGIEISN